jgi:hypothetical protein
MAAPASKLQAPHIWTSDTGVPHHLPSRNLLGSPRASGGGRTYGPGTLNSPLCKPSMVVPAVSSAPGDVADDRSAYLENCAFSLSMAKRPVCALKESNSPIQSSLGFSSMASLSDARLAVGRSRVAACRGRLRRHSFNQLAAGSHLPRNRNVIGIANFQHVTGRERATCSLIVATPGLEAESELALLRRGTWQRHQGAK